MWSGGGLVVLVLQIVASLTISYVGANYVTANVTKEYPSKRASFLNITSTSKPVIQTQLARATESESKLPKAISVNADSSGGYAVFPMPPPSVPIFPFTGNGDVEETFTYQVKKQRQPPSPSKPEEWKTQFDFLKDNLKAKASRDSYETMRNFVNELNYNSSEKISNLTKAVEKTTSQMIANVSTFNLAINQHIMEVANLTALTNEMSRSVKLIQYTHEHDKATLVQQISNLTMLVEKLQREKSEERGRMWVELSRLQAKMDNTTDEIRVHEAHLRYGQQAMLSLRNSLEKNAGQIADLEKSGGPPWVEQTVGCGGVIVANSGIISYKFRQIVNHNERCVWTVRANRRSKINLQLLEDGFQNQSNSDFLTITEFAEDQHPVTLITSTRLEHGSKVLHTFQGPVIFITFYSDSSLPGTGFTLKFDGDGNTNDPLNINAIRHVNLHRSISTGVFKYPSEESRVTYQPNELMTLAINPNNNATSMKIQMIRSDLEKDEYCEFDSINFYGSVQGSYALTKRSDASTQFSGFQFTWEAD